MGNWQGVRIDIGGVVPDHKEALEKAFKLWGAEEVTWDGNDISVAQGNDWVYDKDGRLEINRVDAASWPKPYTVELDKDEYDCFYFDLKKLSQMDPAMKMVVQVEYDFYSDSERLTIEGGKVTKREKLDWVEDEGQDEA